MADTTLFWHDYETSGIDPRCDRPMQFAGIRTDENLNIIAEPVMFYCKLPADCLPSPQACLITGITPQVCAEQGDDEVRFIRRVHDELALPGTCGVGYNSIRFDDEFTRYTLYRNFYDPYEREWRNGNSRWDIIDMVRMTYALRPEGIEWPQHEDGKPSFRLEQLTVANGIEHAAAHDALSDVYATIAVAKLIKDKQPKLYEYCYGLRNKQKALAALDLQQNKPFLHTSSKLSYQHGYTTVMMPLMVEEVNKNAIVCLDLMSDPSLLLDKTAEEIRAILFTKTVDLAEGQQRPGIKSVHINKSPAVAPIGLLDEATQQRLTIDKSLCEKNWSLLKQYLPELKQKISMVFSERNFDAPTDPEQNLYGGFFGAEDKKTMQQIKKSNSSELAEHSWSFNDQRLPELLFRYRARNFPDSLSEEEQHQWHEFIFQRLAEPDSNYMTLDKFFAEIEKMREVHATDNDKLRVLDALENYGYQLTE